MELALVDNEEKIKLVSLLADEIWREHYSSIIGIAQVEYMLEKFLSRDAISTQIKSEGFFYYILLEEGIPFGFIAFKINKEELFLSKLYFLQSYRGRGYSRLCIEWLKKIGREKQIKSILLQVDRKNKNSINVYYKLGFIKAYEKVSDIGNGFVMDDYFLRLDI